MKYLKNSVVVIFITIYIFNNTNLAIYFPISGVVSQLVTYASMFLICILSTKGIKVESTIFLVLLAAVLSLITNDVAAKFNAPVRLLLWVLLISSVGPLLYNYALIRLRNKLFEIFLFLFMMIGGFSFIYWLLGIPSLGRGHFSGITNHSMIFAPVASLGGLYAFYRFIHEPIRKKKYLFLLFFIASILDVVLSASRTSLIGFIAGFLTFLIFNKFRYQKLILIGVILLSLGTVLTMGDDATNEDSSGIQGEMLSRGDVNTREALWNDRINEFFGSPIFGVGFASQHNSFIDENKDENMEGQVEPGSTYLMILSMTGLMGGSAFLWLILKASLNKSFLRHIVIVESYKLAAYVFFAIHFIAEGYLYAAGSFMACIFWLLVGATYPYPNINYKNIL